MIISPCVRNCCLDQQDCCLGCGRLLTEILQWQQLTAPQRERLMVEAEKRLVLRQTTVMHPSVAPSE
ncbi:MULTISPECIES: DUF1289 domain-containing protein [unclassified Arsukibacterium]|uniref:DUF1289 domain-containing protein n=1 Tax=unclassified Arsukibacterium TaxID=2635278 RepID=UPI000C3FB28F|nr:MULTISPECIES: DUF1289 domain-containing protein [unclassified Arsukibacterium]MAA93957.1 Fe-S protein [Rheinheimera sp.]MBM33640.1 Fe-S protein [Rheinheimera sp.]HAW92777.1 DUF1289 domain-containing protein [Candidatus Azambacteria bacterium]